MDLTAAERSKKRDGGHKERERERESESGDECNLRIAINLSEIPKTLNKSKLEDQITQL